MILNSNKLNDKLFINTPHVYEADTMYSQCSVQSSAKRMQHSLSRRRNAHLQQQLQSVSSVSADTIALE